MPSKHVGYSARGRNAHMVPMHRTLTAVVLLVAASSFAQTGDEWSTFPPAPKPAVQPVEAPTPKVEEQAPVISPTPPSSPADAGIDLDEANTRIISQRERVLPGTEAHSPSTWGNRWDAQSNGRVSTGQVGIGTVFVPSARLGAAGVVRVSLLGETLNIIDFPVRSAQNIRSAITFAASFQPFEWGEVFVSYGASANTNSRTSPNLIQTLGDLSVGLKASRQWARGFYAGVDLRLLTFSGVGNQSVSRFAVGFKPTLLATYDFRTASPYAPFLLTLGLGFTLDGSGTLVTNQRLNAAEEFALNVNRYHRFNVSAALEVPFPVVTPFVEYLLGAPLGVPDGQLTGPDGKFVDVSAAMAQQLGVGLKVTAFKDLTLLSGVNLGLSQSVGLGVPATAPWNVYFGAAFAIDPFQRGETKIVETIREKQVQVAQTMHLEGTVTDQRTGQPIAQAVVSVEGLRPAATDAQGQYESLPVSGTLAKLSISREGYKSVEREVMVDPNQNTKIDVALEPEIKLATFQVLATADKKPVKADIAFTGTAAAKVQTNASSVATETQLPAGTYTVTAAADGYLAQTRDVQIQAGGKLTVAFELNPIPKKTLVVFKGDKIEILQQVRFASAKAAVHPESFGLLQQVVDAIVKNNVRRVRVEGHTDNRGSKSANQLLSEDRARAIKEYLISQGIDKDRLESVGYGDSKPIAPNLTARGRELNRRVEFIVLEK